jgi:hypothetical protein
MIGECGLDSSSSGYGSVTGFCEHGNEPSGSVEGGEYLRYLSALIAHEGLCSLHPIFDSHINSCLCGYCVEISTSAAWWACYETSYCHVPGHRNTNQFSFWDTTPPSIPSPYAGLNLSECCKPINRSVLLLKQSKCLNTLFDFRS